MYRVRTYGQKSVRVEQKLERVRVRDAPGMFRDLRL